MVGALLWTKDQLQIGSLIELTTVGCLAILAVVIWWRKKQQTKG
jgi:hypothetical protein